MSQLTRYWITFEYPPDEREDVGVVVGRWWQQVGFGITATDFDDAMAILQREWFGPYDLDVPPIREVVENVDVSTLDDHVRPNMNPPNWRGMWFPRPGPLR